MNSSSHAFHSMISRYQRLDKNQGELIYNYFRVTCWHKFLWYDFREKLSLLLNPTKVLNTEDGYQRDWRGLFTLSGMSQSENTLISQSQDKTGKLLELWIKRSKDNGSVVTVSQLQDSLGIIDRYDVYDDTVVQFSKWFLRSSVRGRMYYSEVSKLSKLNESSFMEQHLSVTSNLQRKNQFYK